MCVCVFTASIAWRKKVAKKVCCLSFHNTFLRERGKKPEISLCSGKILTEWLSFLLHVLLQQQHSPWKKCNWKCKISFFFSNFSYFASFVNSLDFFTSFSSIYSNYSRSRLKRSQKWRNKKSDGLFIRWSLDHICIKSSLSKVTV